MPEQPRLNFIPQPPPSKPIKTKRANEYDPEEAEYNEEDLESFIPSTTDASYFEKAQDFRHIIKVLRIEYLGLKPVQRQLEDGAIVTVYQKDKSKVTGINEEGVETNVRFLVTRLSKHTVLTNWKEERMFEVLRDDMYAWADMMELNYEKFKMNESTTIELRALINDLLECVYRRPIDNKERGDFKPVSNEIRKIMDRLGIDQQQPQQQEYPTGMIDQIRKDTKY